MLLLLIIYGAMLTLPANCSQGKVERNGMTVKWEIKYERIHFEMEAPTDGWLAIGFNEKEGLVGTNLIMGAVKNNQVTMTDDFIVSFGNPQPIEKLGGNNQLSDQKGEEQEPTSHKEKAFGPKVGKTPCDWREFIHLDEGNRQMRWGNPQINPIFR